MILMKQVTSAKSMEINFIVSILMTRATARESRRKEEPISPISR